MKRKGITLTEEQHAQLDAADSYRLLFEKNPQPMWVYDEATLQFLAVNAAAMRQYGFSHQEFLAMTLKDIRPPEELPGLLEFKSQLTLALREFGGATHWKHCKKDGTVIDVACKGARIHFGGRAASLTIIEDVTERKKKTEQAREATENFQVLVHSLEEGVAIHEEGKILSGNRALADMFGCDCAGCIGRSVFDLAAPESRYQVLSHFTAASAEPMEFTLLRQDQSRLRVVVVSRTIRHEGRPANLLIFRDVSERAFHQEDVRFREETFSF